MDDAINKMACGLRGLMTTKCCRDSAGLDFHFGF